MVKAIILDFGKVIYKTRWGEMNEYFMKKNGFSILVGNSEDEELIRIYNDSDVGKEDFRKFFTQLKPDLEDVEAALNNYKEGYAKSKVMNEELLRLIRELNDKGVRLFGFTDIKKDHYDANKDAGVYEGFEKVFTSFDFGCLKSDIKAFDLLTEGLKEFDLVPQDCVFIDDHLPNIENAKKRGYEVIHYEDFPEIEKIQEELNAIFLDN